MKIYWYFFLFIFSYTSLYSQEKAWEGFFVGESTNVKINPKDSLFIGGNLVNKREGMISMHNVGHIFLTGNITDSASGLFQSSSYSNENIENISDTLEAAGSLKTARGSVYCIGDTLQQISSLDTATIWFANLHIRNHVQLGSSIRVLDSLYLENIFDINGYDVYLYLFDNYKYTGNWGKLLNETENTYVWDSDTLREPGSLKMLKLYNDFPDLKSIGITSPTLESTARIKIDRGHRRDTNVTIGSIKKYYLLRHEEGVERFNITYLDRDFDIAHETEEDFLMWEVRTDNISPKARKLKSTLHIVENSVTMDPDENFSDDPTILKRYTIASTKCSYPPVIDLGNDTVVCSGVAITLNAVPDKVNSPNPPFHYEWKLGDSIIFEGWNSDSGNKGILEGVTKQGEYSVKVTNSLGCESFDTVKVIVAPNPEPFIFVDNRIKCESDPFTFWHTDSSGANISSVEWTFGDGTKSSDSSYIKSYAPYCKMDTVLLTLTSSEGCKTSIDTTIIIEQKMQPKIHRIGLYDNTAEYIVYNLTQCNYHQKLVTWYIDNTQAKQGDTLRYTFPDYGKYVVGVKMEGVACISETEDTITISDLGIPKFTKTKTDYCVGETVMLNNVSEENGDSFSYYWEYDGKRREYSLKDPLFLTFQEAGSYPIVLIMKENSRPDWEKTFSDTIHIHANPKINFTSTIYYCKDRYSLAPEETAVHFNYEWKKENSIVATTETYTAEADGVYQLKTTNTLYGCVSEESVQVVLNDRLRPQLGGDREVCGNMTLDAGYPNATYRWNTGENSKQITILETGLYSVYIEDAEGCEGTDTVSITVHETPNVELGNDLVICSNESATLQTPANAEGTVYLWSTGSSDPSIKIANAGTYTVTATHANGICTNSDTINIFIEQAPVINIEKEKYLCNNQRLEINLERDHYYAELIEWTYPDGKTDSGTVLSISEEGIYSVLICYSNGCRNRDSLQIKNAETNAAADFLVASKVDAGDSVLFINRSYPEPLSYHWKFSNGFQTTTENPCYVFYNPGRYTVALTVSDGSCPVTKEKEVIVSSKTKAITDRENEEITLDPKEENTGVFVDLIDAYIYPNPTDGKFKVSVKLTAKDNLLFVVANAKGQILFERKHEQILETEIGFDLGNYPDGVYLVYLSTGNQTKVLKVIISK